MTWETSVSLVLVEQRCRCRVLMWHEDGKATPRLLRARGMLGLYPSVDGLNVSPAWIASPWLVVKELAEKTSGPTPSGVLDLAVLRQPQRCTRVCVCEPGVPYLEQAMLEDQGELLGVTYPTHSSPFRDLFQPVPRCFPQVAGEDGSWQHLPTAFSLCHAAWAGVAVW